MLGLYKRRLSPDTSGTAALESFNAPILRALVANLDPDRRVFIIDLGALRAGTLAALSSYRVRLDILDLDIRSLQAEDDALPIKNLQDRIQDQIPDSIGETANLVLCWNLLNYLSAHEITAVMHALDSRLSPDTQVHALIDSSATDMPTIPVPLSLNESGTIEFLSTPEVEPGNLRLPTPRYSKDELVACMPGLMAEQTVLLSNGQKEYLFRKPSV